MIEVTRLQSQKIVVNADLIEFVEETPDTMITTTTGKKLIVRESVNDVIDKVVAYRRQCLIMKLAHKKRLGLRGLFSSCLIFSTMHASFFVKYLLYLRKPQYFTPHATF